MNFWHEWRGSSDNDITMLIRHIISFRGYKLDLHKFVAPDWETCFHTHPAISIRFILWGGYTEQIRSELSREKLSQKEIESYERTYPKYKNWRPFYIGIIKPEFCHRIHKLRKKVSYSLWFRFPKTNEVKIFGEC